MARWVITIRNASLEGKTGKRETKTYRVKARNELEAREKAEAIYEREHPGVWILENVRRSWWW